jgi:amino acid adenylation domain-containing protein
MTPRNAGELLSGWAERPTAGRVAIVDGSRRVSYDELLRRAEGFSAGLRGRGVRHGDRVVMFLPRSVEAVVALFGTWFAGGVAVVANERLRAQQVHHVVEHSEAAVVVTDDRQLRSVAEFPCPTVINLDHEPASDAGPREAVAGGDLAMLVYTSGSTGLPKGIMLSHGNLLAGTRIVAGYLGLGDRDVILSVLPFSFDYGLNQLLTALFAGATLVIQRSMFPHDVSQALLRERVTGLAAVPTFWSQLAGRHSPFLKTAYPDLRYITNSGGRFPERVLRAIRIAHPQTQIFPMYGLTEAFRSTYLPPGEVDHRPSSMGKAIPEVEILVVDDRGAVCAPGQVGELVHCGGTVSMGYWRDPANTARMFRPHPLRAGAGERVVFSGDLVTTDADGFLYYVGRKDKQIKSRGVRVSPEEIERCIQSSAAVVQVVSFAVPREDGDADIVAAIVPADAAGFRADALSEFCRHAMPEYMQPRVIWPMTEFPLTSSGKPDRCEIERQYVERHQHAATAS